MATASKIIIKHFFRPEQKVTRRLPVYHPPLLPMQELSTEENGIGLSEKAREERLDLNGYLISHPSSTFFVKVSGESSSHLGINPGDLLIVDQTLEVLDGNLVVGNMQEAFFTSFIKIKNKQLYLAAEHLHEHDRLITPDLKCTIWGVVSYVIHKPAMKQSSHVKKKLTPAITEEAPSLSPMYDSPTSQPS
jgi:DNA polymerase V